MEMSILQKLPSVLLPWFAENKRDLPWRTDRDPYHVWLSEIMLQQTRVEAVKGYYLRFLEALPSVADLASAEDDHLHKLWEGLGYYSRVRNLKKAAITIVKEYGGSFPQNYEQIRALPGIGDYTAGAVCSIAFDMPKAAVDGNVLRVITRLTESGTPVDSESYKKQLRSALETVYPENAGDFTQALMELGATVCGPNRKPECGRCPCREFCGGHLHGTAEQFPVKKPKSGRKTEKLTVFILRCDGQYALQKRPEKGLLAGLWQFPNVSGHLDTAQAVEAVEALGLHPRQLRRQVERQHIFTHIQWKMRGYYLDVAQPQGEFEWLTPAQITGQAALPTAFRQFWEEEDYV